MGVRLLYGADVREQGVDGRSFADRVAAGEFGPFDSDGSAEESLESHFVEKGQPSPQANWCVYAAADPYSGAVTGAVVGVLIADVANRDTRRNLGGGLTESQLDQAMAAAAPALRRLGLKNPRLWLLQATG